MMGRMGLRIIDTAGEPGGVLCADG